MSATFPPVRLGDGEEPRNWHQSGCGRFEQRLTEPDQLVRVGARFLVGERQVVVVVGIRAAEFAGP
ncbi:hypothetical protein [Limnoglobus roseus]|uniref:Uncharacterized protein n=1 Tax=Limnoglobus roseus TaxID=2598579 RepID=A0A5C1AI36_9BACT|nr:hypothetical protein [Limnoglobus roseus]QEL16794.1 hypothetical protein PX52LOC_03767 [Limnoglobus roseus]